MRLLKHETDTGTAAREEDHVLRRAMDVVERAIAAGHRGDLHNAVEALRVAQVKYRQALFRASAAGNGETCRAMSDVHEEAREVIERGTIALHRS